jgi:thiol-disulfide isomerase/thioredoxin
LVDEGPAPEFQGIKAWLNGGPLSVSGLKGHVVLVDFWTYSCINCIRSLPHIEALYRAYRSVGLVVVGVHSPEFAFEHVVSNVKAAASRLGVVYPVAIDNDFATWNAYQNQYWPAEYLIDSRGHVRHSHFGEGDYAGTESAIRTLLLQDGAILPRPTEAAASSGGNATTPETYLGYSRIERYVGAPIRRGVGADYAFPATLPPEGVSLGGRWTVGAESVTAGSEARVRLRFSASTVYLVLGGTGSVSVTVDGTRIGMIRVGGYPRTYALASGVPPGEHLLEASVSQGVQAYDFTFG